MPHIARVTGTGALAVLEQRTDTVAPDPYLAHSNLVIPVARRTGGREASSPLRVVK